MQSGKVRRSVFAVATAVIASLMGPQSLQAQVQRSGGGANAQLAQQYQQAVAERTQLQADNEKIKKELEDTKKQLQAAKQQLNASKASAGTAASQVQAAQAATQTAEKSLEQTKSRMQELINRYRDTAVTLRAAEADRARLQQDLAQSKSAFDRCADRNYQLYQLDNEVLDRYQHQSAFSYLERAEPFARIKRTEIENLAEEYKVRAEELRVQKAPPASAAASSPSEPATPAAGASAPAADASAPAAGASAPAAGADQAGSSSQPQENPTQN
jgi:chromosome segregation ATPase